MAKPSKVQAVEQIRELLGNAKAAILTDYRGLTVAEITELRHKLREVGGEFHVVKNTLFRRAAEGTPAEALDPYLEGPTAAAFAHGEAPPVAKVLIDFAKEHKEVALKAGLIEGQVYSPDQVQRISTLPGREVLYARIMAGINSPAAATVGTIQGVIRKLMGTIQAVAEKQAAA